MSQKDRYIHLCEGEAYVPLFQQAWWMDAVCHNKRWDVAIVDDSHGNIVAALPYLVGRKMGMRYIVQPQLTQYNGPWLRKGLSVDHIHRYTNALIDQLEALHVMLYMQCFAPEHTDWLPFYWRGYRQTTRYTYRFPSIADPNTLMSNASRGRKQNMAEIAERYSIEPSFPIAEFATMHTEYFERHSGHDLLSTTLIERVCKAAIERNQGLLWALVDDAGQAKNVSFVVYDNQCAYALMSAIAPDAPRNSQTYLFWNIIRHLSSHTQAFDFEGSMEHGNEYFYRSFGAIQTPYHCVYRSRIPMTEKILGL